MGEPSPLDAAIQAHRDTGLIEQGLDGFDILGSLLESKTLTGSDWEVCIIEEGVSTNGLEYGEQVLREAIPLFEDAPVCAYRYGQLPDEGQGIWDHPPLKVGRTENVPSGNIVGWFENVRFGEFNRLDGTRGRGLLASFHISETAKWLRTLMLGAWKRNKKQVVGLSINADGPNVPRITDEGRRVYRVLRIDDAKSTEVVSKPAAGGGPLALVASQGYQLNIERERRMNPLQKILDALFEHRPTWVDGFENKVELFDQIIESATQRATDVVSELDSADADAFTEASNGLAMLHRLGNLVKADKKDDALGMIEKMVAGMPQPAPQHQSVPAPAPAPATPAPVAPVVPAAPVAPVVPAAPAANGDLQAQIDQMRESQDIANTATAVERLLGESDLPDLAKSRIRERFDGRKAEAKAITAMIESEKTYLDELNSGGAGDGDVTGCGSGAGTGVQVTDDQVKKWQNAMTAMVCETDLEDGVAPFRSMHESWRMMNRDYGSKRQVGRRIMAAAAIAFPGCEDDSLSEHQRAVRESALAVTGRALRESTITTALWAVLFGNAAIRLMDQEYRHRDLADWEKIARVRSAEDFREINVSRLGGYSSLDVVAEGGTYQPFATQPTEENSAYSVSKRGNTQDFTERAAINDDTDALRSIPRDAGRAGIRTIYERVFGLFELNPNTDYDATAWIAAGHDNRGTTALGEASLAAGIIGMAAQTQHNSLEIQNFRARWLIVPAGTVLTQTADELTSSPVKIVSNNDATTPSWIEKRNIEVIEAINFTDANNWYLIADKADINTIEISFLDGKKEPEILVQNGPTVGARFTNDVVTFRIKIPGVESKAANHRGVWGAQVA